MAAWPLLPGVCGAAQFSPDGTHRLWLERWWFPGAAPGKPRHVPFVMHIGMNPSVAGADRDDLTIRKDIEFTKRMGYHRMIKCNIGTLIETDSTKLTGDLMCWPGNIDTIISIAQAAQFVVVATGVPPESLVKPARDVFARLMAEKIEMKCFGLTKSSWPKHSSRLAYATPLVPFDG